MKNIRSNIIAAGILCLSLGMTSCTKGFLDVESKTESTTGNFYKTEQDAYRALLGCYDGYRRATCGSAVNFLVSAEVMGYECFGGSGASDGNGMRVTDRFDLSEMPSSTGSSWSGYYAGIYRCNELITRENSIQWNETGSMHTQYMAECHAIRAFLYFDVVRQFGNIPLLTKPTDENIPQADPADVYKLIFDDLNFITLILISQLVISVSQLSVEFIRSWIMLHMNTRINISLISDFLAKLMKLPLHYFDTKMIGDIMQRIGDHGRIESFLTGSSISTLFSFVNFFIFAFVLAYYNLGILAIFLVGNSLYICWILVFMKYRRELDIRRFAQAAGEQSSLIQLVTAMQEIKLNNCEKQKRWQWERIQVKLFKISVKGLALGQVQQVGSVFFNQTTNIVISFIAAKSVVEGNMTLGMMMSLTYIIGQLSGPIGSFIGFAQQLQDAKISLERLNEIHGQKDEEQDIASKLTVLPERRDIRIENLSFSYDGADRDYVLNDVNLNIPEHKVTAIVGASGSGKTTLIKLMLGFYTPNKGDIKIGETPLDVVNPHLWRAKSGSVMQDGFIFSDTIANNIAVGEEQVDVERLRHAVTVANIRDFIDSLPLGYNTKIGMEGNGISQGQRQRLLIARAVYKNPEFLFFDEATNALDANNEREIMEHLHTFYRGKTVVVVAHRLSTVCDADKIVVLDRGAVAEEGTHRELTEKKGLYYQLVKNQLELGS